MSTGKLGEDRVSKHYEGLGWKLLDRNFTNRFGKQIGELDLVFAGKKELVFVEVKTRSTNRFGLGVEAVDVGKQRKLINIAKFYLRRHPQYQGWNYRFDVAVVNLDPVRGQTSNGVDNKTQPVIIIPNAIEDLD
ncbi:MAG: YraN family protein [Candidatus Doudnabacteria bacterium RIFCSPLOWO2_01_FULL_44_21]|uniref:UPF0102 protein A3B10_02630 n=1 Tax=Candidatus Doudnabacteria bacterium RIFCSPLOWO2_01_FULL_44_21 TaxID=1817841 RepID=A0A1F5Q206_9BACT|nr:MAG: YraN family protein [Candidatus Doudnabacteria bacterium RIFCSPHIGHO2_02_FULL_43_13b]OGE96186.1 MAG: YraN family protein [Candidatus Doudnabacteria bacterium RIFCSPLOWO2_01_FULL_44_21]